MESRKSHLALAFALWLPMMGACGGVRVGQSAEEAQASPRPTAAEPPNQNADAPGETTPLITVDLEATPDAGAH